MLQAKVIRARDTLQICKEVSWLTINCGSSCSEEPRCRRLNLDGRMCPLRVPTATTFRHEKVVFIARPECPV